MSAGRGGARMLHHGSATSPSPRQQALVSSFLVERRQEVRLPWPRSMTKTPRSIIIHVAKESSSVLKVLEASMPSSWAGFGLDRGMLCSVHLASGPQAQALACIKVMAGGLGFLGWVLLGIDTHDGTAKSRRHLNRLQVGRMFDGNQNARYTVALVAATTDFGCVNKWRHRRGIFAHCRFDGHVNLPANG